MSPSSSRSRTFLRVVLGAGLAAVTAAAGVALADSAPRADLLKVRVGGDRARVRVVLELDKSVSGRLISPREDVRRVLLALPRVDTAGDMSGAGEGLVKSWAVDRIGGGARLDLELKGQARVVRRFVLAPGDGLNIYRYVVDVEAVGAPAAAPAASAVPKAPPPPPEEPPAKKVIVIDAGHGGKDSGAVGQRTFEKNDALSAAHVLKETLERTGRYTVVMTRDTDAYIPLATRVQIARRANADLFISLHADSIGTLGAATRGASVYTLSERGADRTARGVFGRSDWFMNVELPGRDSATKRILLDLTQRQNVNRSSTFAELLLDRLAPVTPLLARSHRDANLMVLLAPDVPAVLLEMGFITNPSDEEGLADPGHRRKMMTAVAAAIDAYFDAEGRSGLA